MYDMHVEPHMELSKKTTLRFPPDLHRHLSRLARQRGLSFGELVCRACEAQYGIVSKESRLASVRDLEAMSLPVPGCRVTNS
jgi:hypothetical protein